MTENTQQALHQSNGQLLVDSTIANHASPVVLFALSWCSFCHAARRLLEQLGVNYQLHEIDKGEFLKAGLQTEVRTRLRELTQSSTLPQLFVGGELVGGYTETYTAHHNGRLATLFRKHNVSSKLTGP
jgi:glutaredoxin